ncbi:transposase-like protein [Ochrobactrum sp. AN78]|nr:transposase-like protein [Ochrobactrum sp. AN78]
MLKGRHFDKSVILLCVRWYLAYNVSLHNLKELMAERRIDLDHSTILRNRWKKLVLVRQKHRFSTIKTIESFNNNAHYILPAPTKVKN